jgi:hypothetical protein
MRKACGLMVLWLAAQSCLSAQTAGIQRLGTLLKAARGQVALTKDQAGQIRQAFLAWTDTEIRRGATIEQLNASLAANDLLAPEALYRTDDIYQPFAGYLEKVTSQSIQSANDLVQINLEIGMTCAFDQTAVIYRRNPMSRVGWINYRDTEGSVAWGINTLTVGPAASNGDRIVAAGLMHAWCTSAWGSIELRVWRLAGNELKPLLTRDLGARRDEDVTAVIRGETVAFRYNRGIRDTDILIRSGIEKYRIEANRVTRIAPIALNILGFIDEWLDLNEAQSAQWSSGEGVRDRAAAVVWSKSVAFEGGSRCEGSPTLWQVSVKSPDSEERRVFLVNEAGSERLQMAGFKRQPLRECPPVDLAALMMELPQ